MAKQGIKRRPVIDKTKNAKEEPFEFNEGQERVLKLLNSQDGKKITEILIAAGSRCFTGDTLVQTDEGHVAIRDIRRGDRVLSTDMETKFQEFQTVTSNNKSKQVRDMVEILMTDGTLIRTTFDHEFMLEGEFQEIGKWLYEKTQKYRCFYFQDGIWYSEKIKQMAPVYFTRYTDGLSLNLSARELNIDEVFAVRSYEQEEELWDLSVEKNSNFCVTEHNLIVHNSGKTFLIMAILCTLSVKYPGSRHLVARKHFSHVKGAVWLDTLPKVIDLLFKDLKPHLYWNNTDFFLQFPNGSEIWMGGLDDKERVDKILGREYMTIFFNEASEIDYTTYVKVKTRLAQLIPGGKNRIYVDENPPSSKHWTKVLFVDKMDPDNPKIPVKNPQKYAFLQIHPWENKANISPEYLEMIENLPANERLRFFEGKFRDDAKFALWKSETINRYRVYEHPPLRRIVVAVDPAVTAKDESDETGIVVMGVSFQDELYTLADYTDKYTPTEWATKTVEVYQMWKADKIVAEVNNGGDLVETVVKQVNKYVNYEGVYATRNKYTRAEPVAALMEQGLDHHVGELPDLETEMTTWEGKNGSASPNRIDAKVWAAFALIPELTEYTGRTTGSFAMAMRMGMRIR